MALILERPWTTQPQTPTAANVGAGFPAPFELWSHGLSGVGSVRGLTPTTEATFSRRYVNDGVGINVSATGRRYTQATLDGADSIAWVVAAYRDNSATSGSYISVVRKDGTVTPIREEPGGNMQVVLWSGVGTQSANYGSIASCKGRVNIFAGRITNGAAKIYLNGGSPISIAYTAPVSSGAKALCFGATETGGEIAAGWTFLEAAIWRNNIPSERALYDLMRNRFALFQPRRIYIPGAVVGGNASVTLPSAAATSAAGTISATGGAAVTLTGAAATASAGTLTATGGATAAITGASTTAAAGPLTATGGAVVALVGASATAAAGIISASASGSASVTLPSALATAAAGEISATGGATVTLPSAAAVAAAGDITVSLAGDVSVTLPSASATASAGAISATGGAVVVLTGAGATAYAGTISATGDVVPASEYIRLFSRITPAVALLSPICPTVARSSPVAMRRDLRSSIDLESP